MATAVADDNPVRLLLGPSAELYCLPDFIAKYAPSIPFDCKDDDDDDDRIRKTLIAPLDECRPLPKVQHQIHQSLPSLVDDVVWSLVQRRERARTRRQDGRNVLCQGYVLPNATDALGAQPCRTLPGVAILAHINHNVDYCKTSAMFRILHSKLGDDVLRMLLLNTRIFLPIERDNYLQLTGPPLQTKTIEQTKVKKRKRFPVEIPKQLLPQVVIPRKDLFYSNSFVPNVGLPSTHRLNTCSPEELLDIVFHVKVNNKRKRKRWKRLRSAVPLFQDLLQRHRSCDYARLLERHCPLPDFCRRHQDGVVELADVSAAFTPLACVVSFAQAVMRRVIPTEMLGNWNMNRLLDVHVPTFVKLRRQEQLANKCLSLRTIKVPWLRINGSRTDHQTGQLLLAHLVRWLFSDYLVPLLRATFYVTETEFSSKQVTYYRKPVWSLFRNLSMRKLQQHQYVEISAKEAANKLSQQTMGFARLKLTPKTTGVRPIVTLCKREQLKLASASEHCTDVAGGPSQKKRRLDLKSPLLSTNRIMNDVFSVLQYECSQKNDAFGAGIDGLYYLYPIYRDWLQSIRLRDLPTRMYFASVDIQHCYDNIDQEYLLNVVEHILSENDYLIQHYDVLHPFESMGRLVKRTKKKVGPPATTFEPFHRSVAELSTDYRRAIFADGVYCSVSQKEKMMVLLREHLTSHLVAVKGRYGDRYLLQTSGIPQGSVLSTLLCNMYYGSVERRLLPEHFEYHNGRSAEFARKNLLVRMVDDFLLVTTEFSILETFMKTMYHGNPSLGVCINSDKTNVSAELSFVQDDGTGITVQPREDAGSRDFFPWCGMLFHLRTGEVRVDYARLSDGRGGEGLTVERACNEGVRLAISMKTFVRPRCLAILFDSQINGLQTQLINFYQLHVLAAVKTAEYLRTSNIVPSNNLPFLLKTIDSTVLYGYTLVNERLKQAGAASPVSFRRSVAHWIGWKAFDDVFHYYYEFCDLANAIRLKADEVVVHGYLSVVSEALESIQIETMLPQDIASAICGEKS